MAIHKFIRAVAAAVRLPSTATTAIAAIFTFVADIVAAALAIVERGVRGGVYNVAPAGPFPRDVSRWSNGPLVRRPLWNAPRISAATCAPPTATLRLRRAVGYEPATPLEEGIAAEASWLLGEPAALPAFGRAAPIFGPPRRTQTIGYRRQLQRGHVISNCLGSCWLNPPREGGMEVIVVDNASDDGSAETLAVRDDIIFLRTAKTSAMPLRTTRESRSRAANTSSS